MTGSVIREIYQQQHTRYDVPLDTFKVCWGYKDRDTIQIRLAENGMVWLVDDRESRHNSEERAVVAHVSFEALAAEWRQFVIHMRGKS